MVDEPVNNPRDHVEERFLWLEAQVADINRNMNLLMMGLTNKLGLFE